MYKIDTLAKWMLSLSVAGALAIAPLAGCSSQGGSTEDEATPVEETTDETEEVPEEEESIWVVSGYKAVQVDSDGSETEFGYTYELDEQGNCLSETNGDDYTATFTHDEDGWPIEMVSGDVTMTNEVEKDESGRALSMKSEESKTEYTYNDEGNIVESNTTSEAFAVDEEGNKIEGSEFTMKRQITYGDDGFITGYIRDHGDGKSVTEYTYEYGDDGLPVSSTGTTRSLDADGNEIEGTSTTFTRTFEYDEQGNLVKVVTEDEYGTTTYEYTFVEVAHPSVATKVNQHLRQL